MNVLYTIGRSLAKLCTPRLIRLLEAGVRIYEWQPTPLHAKVFVADPADTVDAANIEILAAAKSDGLGKDWPAMNSDIVNPMPVMAPAPIICAHEYSSGFTARPSRTANADATTMPTGFPITIQAR